MRFKKPFVITFMHFYFTRLRAERVYNKDEERRQRPADLFQRTKSSLRLIEESVELRPAAQGTNDASE